MSINLYVARHGNTFDKTQVPIIVGKKTDLSLVEKGREQAMTLAHHFQGKSINFDAVFSGRLKRQTEFAQIICKQLSNSLKITHSEALDELDYGTWEGLAPENLINDSRYQAWTKRGVWPDTFAETEQSRIEILLNWLNCLRTQFEPGQNILAVSSNGIIRQLARFSDIACGETIWSRLADNSALEQLKVSTGAYCEFTLTDLGLGVDLKLWNISPISR